jgi:hypothetical protein
VAPLATAFVEIRPQDDDFKKTVERNFGIAGKSAGQKFGDAYTKDANGKLRNAQGQFVKMHERTGTESGKVFGKTFGDNFHKTSVPAAEKTGKESGSRFGKGFGGGFKLSLGSLTGILAGLGGLQVFKGFIDGARDAAKTSRITAAVIKSTGGAANVTASQIGDLTQAIGNKVGVDDDAIASGTNLLLTFKGVRNEAGAGNDIFNLATRSIVDMTAAMNHGTVDANGLKGSTIQLGKALNDPIKGITALTRVGVTFTDQQKKQITQMVKAGNTLGAQKIILKEVNSEFGGAAAAAADPVQKLSAIWGNFGEQIGGFILPVLSRASSFISGSVIPGVQSLFRSFQTGQRSSSGLLGILQSVAAAAGEVGPKLVAAFHSITGAAGGFFQWLGGASTGAAILRGALFGLVTAMVAIKVATLAWAAVQTILNVVLTANPIGIVVLAIAALVGGLILAYRHSETFRNIVQATWRGIQTVIGIAWNTIIHPIFIAISFYITKILVPYYKLLWSVVKVVWKGIQVAIQIAWFAIRVVWALIMLQLRAIWKTFQTFYSITRPIWTGLGKLIQSVWSGFIRPAFDAIKRGLSATKSAFSTAISAISSTWNKLKSITKGPVSFMVNTVYMGGIRKVWEGVRKLVPGLPDIPSVHFAQGGIFPGYTPGRDIYQMPMASFSGGESIMRPEFTRAVGSGFVRDGNSIARKGGPMAVRSWLSGGQAFADGGILGSIKNILKKPLDLAGQAGNFILEKGADAFAKRILNPVLNSIPHGDDLWSRAIFSLPKRMIDGFLDFVHKVIDPALQGGGDALGVVRAAKKYIGQGDDRGVDNDNRFTRHWGWPRGTPWCALFASTAIQDAHAQKHYRGFPTAAAAGYDGMQNVPVNRGRAGDLATYNGGAHINIIEKPISNGAGYWTIGGNQNAVVQRSIRGGQGAVLRPNEKGGIATDTWRRVFGYEWQNNWGGEHDRNNPLAQVYSKMPPNRGAQLGKDIVKGYVFDTGGILNPGDVALNMGKKPEGIFTHDQLTLLASAGRRGGGGPAVAFTGDIHINDGSDLDRLMKRASFEARASGFGGV